MNLVKLIPKKLKEIRIILNPSRNSALKDFSAQYVPLFRQID